MDSDTFKDHFFVAAHESGRELSALPTWGDNGAGAIHFDASRKPAVERRDIDDVPGAFQLFNVLTERECDQFIAITEWLGYHPDSPVSLSHAVRHNDNVNWVVAESVDEPIWLRCAAFVHERLGGQSALGINARFRFYRYQTGDFFRPHTDGAWPGSRIIDGKLEYDAYGDRESMMTFLLFLSDGYEGGRTQFFAPAETATASLSVAPPRQISIVTPKGAALCFPHGSHPQHCVHAGELVSSGLKYIMRSDVLYPL